ncbi:MAG: VCBS repeat-containing protein, partial [Holophagales bacterium]|nr:VCBS repeat-containing protein [Holophagales bacterium]
MIIGSIYNESYTEIESELLTGMVCEQHYKAVALAATHFAFLALPLGAWVPEEATGSGGAARAAYFVDVTKRAGVDRAHRTRTFENPYAHIMEGYTALGASASVADVDGDGFEDVFFTLSNADGRNLLYRNRGDFTFEEIGEAAGVAAGNDAANASADSLFFDYDNDGDPDLLVLRFGRNLLYENVGAGEGGTGKGGVRFEDVSERAGIGRHYLNSIVAIAFDYDLDSDLDLFIGNYFAPVNLFDPETPR